MPETSRDGSLGVAASTGDAVAAAATSGTGSGGQHYDEVAANYEAAFFYSSVEYRDWVMGHVLRHFGLPDEVRQRPADVPPAADASVHHPRGAVVVNMLHVMMDG